MGGLEEGGGENARIDNADVWRAANSVSTSITLLSLIH